MSEISTDHAVRIIDSELSLVPYYPDYDTALKWYLDPDVCRQSDNIDHVYDLDRLKAMYSYLSSNGECYYILFNDAPVGYVTLLDSGEVCIVVCKEFQNRHIGRRCIHEMLRLAKEKGMSRVRANIYSFNLQSMKMFLSAGFEQTAEEWFECAVP